MSSIFFSEKMSEWSKTNVVIITFVLPLLVRFHFVSPLRVLAIDCLYHSSAKQRSENVHWSN